MDIKKLAIGAGIVGGALYLIQRAIAEEATPKPNLDISKWSDPASVNPGGNVIYRVAITNVGSGIATGIRLIDSLIPGWGIPQNVKFIDCTGSRIAGGMFDIHSDLLGGQNCVIQFTLTVPIGAMTGLYQNEVSIIEAKDMAGGVALGRGRLATSYVMVR